MAKERIINTRFWNDTWIRENLNALDRYFFIYLLTNDKTNISGIYEIPLSTIALETGLDKEELTKTMFPKLKPKVYYRDGWVVLTNFLRYQHTNSDSVVQGMVRELNDVPEKVLLWAKEGGWGEGGGMVGGASHILNLTKLNLTKLNGTEKHNSNQLFADSPMTDNLMTKKEWQTNFSTFPPPTPPRGSE